MWHEWVFRTSHSLWRTATYWLLWPSTYSRLWLTGLLSSCSVGSCQKEPQPQTVKLLNFEKVKAAQLSYAVISHKPMPGTEIQMSCSDKDKCKNRKMNKNIRQMNILSVKTLTKHCGGANLICLVTITYPLIFLRYRTKFSFFLTI